MNIHSDPEKGSLPQHECRALRRLAACTCPDIGWETICFTHLAPEWPFTGQRNPAHLQGTDADLASNSNYVSAEIPHLPWSFSSRCPFLKGEKS